jgi:hypothetical protein
VRIINRKEFLSMPAYTLFSKYQPVIFGPLEIKMESSPHDDYFYIGLAEAIDAPDSGAFLDGLERAREGRVSIGMDLDVQGRDGCFDQDQLFAIWDSTDLIQLLDKIQECIKAATGRYYEGFP